MIATFSRALILAAIFSCLTAGQILAKDVIVDFKPEAIDLVDKAGRGSSLNVLKEDWLEIKVEFDLDSGAEQKMVEELTFKFYIWAYDFLGDGGEEPVTLVGETTFINVPDEKDHIVSMYLSPSAQHRYGGPDHKNLFKKAGAKNKEFNIHVEALVSGNVVGETDLIKKGFEKGWFTGGKKVENVLIEVQDSPFWSADAIKYNQIKKSRR
ncbi:MAG: hypothetical protein AAF984_00950 [Verrucomicrobiota bacterium]